MMPDIETAVLDPFSNYPTAIIFTRIRNCRTKEWYDKDPRMIAKKAEAKAKSSGYEKAYFGPEPEFFLFDKLYVDKESGKLVIDSREIPKNYELGLFAPPKGAYFPESTDKLDDVREEIIVTLQEMGIPMTYDHHEVALAQGEIGIKHATLTEMADRVMLFKRVCRKVGKKHDLIATFMPKIDPLDNGNGMHVHQSLWTSEGNAFAGEEYSGLSGTALSYIAGVLKHGVELCAITNPTTNSYSRLVAGFESPTRLVYSKANRSAAVRIPTYHTNNPAESRAEVRFPDPAANPYLAFSALLLAGLEGVERGLHPGNPLEKNIYELTSEAREMPSISGRRNGFAISREKEEITEIEGNLKTKLEALKKNHEFLTRDGVFTEEVIDTLITERMEDVKEIEKVISGQGNVLVREVELYLDC